MSASGWRYVAFRLGGDGRTYPLDWEVPLSGVEITSTLSGPGALSATIEPEYARLKGPDGDLLIKKWSTLLVAEKDGSVRGGGILVDPKWTGAQWALDCMGFSGYPQGMPYTDSRYFVEEDPLDIYRAMWTHLQSQRRGDLGVTLDGTKSPVRIGTVLKQREFDTQNGPVAFESGPYKLTWYQTSDLGQAGDELAKDTPFDYREKWGWKGEELSMHIEIGYPRLGRRLHGLTFIVGENIFSPPDIGTNEDYANEILTLGAGEGAAMKHGSAKTADHGALRRAKVVTNKQWRTKRACDNGAKDALHASLDFDNIGQVVVRDHPNAPIGSWSEGDEILVQVRGGWKETAVWCRVLSSTISPEDGARATLTLQRPGDFATVEG